CNKEAANDLVNDVESAILERLNNPESFEPYHSLKERTYPYYRIYVKNYTIYYVVIPDGDNKKIMEIRRMLHNLQDRDKYI
ncbi:MAG: type II toxin-antitoxin system RelE/ParE family toxin, partial [Butyrivibrio sp.]|uniref:type II toxin-antitoxin system RelE/ParE family toxin n=1 Tax=Butyrivibrio sp. TaxID=28121 RepID=UPI0025D37B66